MINRLVKYDSTITTIPQTDTDKNQNKHSLVSWLVFIILSIVWGSSFILMKGGLLFLSAIQVASLRIIFSAIVLLPWSLKYIFSVPFSKIRIIILSGILGSLLPAYLFCIAEEKIDSAFAGTLNSLTPVFVAVTGVLFFRSSVSTKKIIGISIAFLGSLLLLFATKSLNYKTNISYGLLIFLATISYGTNANLVHKYLAGISSLKIAAIALTLCAIPALFILYASNFFKLNLLDHNIHISLIYILLLAVFGTALATVLYYKLVKTSGALFSSMVTYCIPIVANIWGLIFGETIGLLQISCLLIILSGVYIANSNQLFMRKFKRK